MSSEHHGPLMIDTENVNTDATESFIFPATLAQQRFWFLDQLEPGNTAYNIAVRWKLLGPVDPACIERAFNEILRRHEVLRTKFLEEDGVPFQVTVPSLNIEVPVFDLRSLPEDEREAEAERATLEVAKQPFDLRTLPLIRAALIRLADEEHTVLVTVHHIVADGWSIGLLAREMCQLYEAYVRGAASPLAELPIQYADFAVWQKKWLTGSTLKRHAEFWKQQLHGVMPFELLSDNPRPPFQTSNGTILSVLLPRTLTDALQDYSGRQGVTFFMTAVAAFMTLLHRYTGKDDIAVSTQVAGRNRLELENLIGLFINTLVLRGDLSGDPEFTELLSRTKKMVSETLAHQDMPFEQLVGALRLKRDLSRTAVFQVNFIYQRAFVENVEFAGVKFVDLPSRSPGALYDLNVFMVERPEGWRLSCEYNTDLFKPNTITGMLEHLRSLFQAIAANPRQRISELPLSANVDQSHDDDGKTPNSLQAGESVSDPHGHGAGPRDDVEAGLCKIWAEVLNVPSVSIKDDFFELGGHSLLAGLLFAKINKLYGKKLPLAALFQAPTVEKLALVLRLEEPDQLWSSVVPLQTGGSRPPIFIISGLGGNVVRFRDLALHLGPDQPVYALQPPGLDGKRPFLTSVEEMASHYIQEIRPIQPEGPYCLAGYSFGGLVTFEMARQLSTQGAEVGLLALLDAPEWRYLKASLRTNSLDKAVDRFKYRLHTLLFGPDRLAVLRSRARRRISQVIFNFYKAIQQPIPQAYGTIEDVNWFAATSYAAQPYAGRVTLLRTPPAHQVPGHDYLLGWGGLALEGVEVHDVPGDHEDMMKEPNVRVLAEKLTQCMERADRAISGPVPALSVETAERVLQ